MVKAFVFGVVAQAGMPAGNGPEIIDPRHHLQKCIQDHLAKKPELKTHPVDWMDVITNGGEMGAVRCHWGGSRMTIFCDETNFEIHEHCPSMEVLNATTFTQCQAADYQGSLQQLAQKKGFTVDSIRQSQVDDMEATAVCVTDGPVIQITLTCHHDAYQVRFSAEDCKHLLFMHTQVQNEMIFSDNLVREEFDIAQVNLNTKWSALPFQSLQTCEAKGGLYKQQKTAQEAEEMCAADCCKPQWICHLWYTDIAFPEEYCKQVGGQDARFEWDETTRKSNENRCHCGCCVPVGHFTMDISAASDELIDHIHGRIDSQRAQVFFNQAEQYFFTDGSSSDRLQLGRSLQSVLKEIEFARQFGLQAALDLVMHTVDLQSEENVELDRWNIDGILLNLQGLLDANSVKFMEDTFQQEIQVATFKD